MVVYKESRLIKTWSCDNKNNMTKQRVWGGALSKTERKGRGLCTSYKGCGCGLGSSNVRQLPLLSSPLAASPRECHCDGAGDRERKGEALKKGKGG